MVTEETLLDDGDFLLLLVEPSDRPNADEAPIKEFAQISNAIGVLGGLPLLAFRGQIARHVSTDNLRARPATESISISTTDFAERALWWKSAAGSTSEVTRRSNVRAAMWPA